MFLDYIVAYNLACGDLIWSSNEFPYHSVKCNWGGGKGPKLQAFKKLNVSLFSAIIHNIQASLHAIIRENNLIGQYVLTSLCTVDALHATPKVINLSISAILKGC